MPFVPRVWGSKEYKEPAILQEDPSLQADEKPALILLAPLTACDLSFDHKGRAVSTHLKVPVDDKGGHFLEQERKQDHTVMLPKGTKFINTKYFVESSASKSKTKARQWWHTHLFPGLGRQKKAVSSQ